VTYPSGTGLTTSYSYYGNTSSDSNPADDDQRLEEIKNMSGSGSTQLSKFDYTYNAVGTIATWTQQADSSTAVVNTLSYDNADELTNAVQSGGGSASNAYHYDPAGNRLAEITASTTTAGQFNNLNQLKAITSSSTSTTVAGHTSANISSATIDAVPATITNSTNFTANVPIPSGTNVVSVVAQPTSSSGVLTTQRYQIVASGSTPTSLSYDANGNVTTDENGNGYAWDALNRLTKITYSGGATSNFAYDGLSRRVSIIEKNSGGTVTSTKLYLWTGSEIAEERSSGTTVTKRFFPQGEQQSGTDYYYTKDHLGSIREMLNSSGSIVARYSYDPYGRTTLVSGTNLATFQYDHYYVHSTSGLYLTRYRAFDPNTGRWLSRDPIAEQGGLNLYGYVRDDPTNAWDLTGLCSCCVAEAQAVLNAANVLYSAVQDNGVENVFVGNPANDFTPEGVIKDKVEDKVIEKTAGEEASFANSLLSTIASGFAGLTHLQILHYAQNLLDAIQKYHYCRQAYARYPGLCDPTDANNLIEKAQKKVEDAKDLYNKQTE